MMIWRNIPDLKIYTKSEKTEKECLKINTETDANFTESTKKDIQVIPTC